MSKISKNINIGWYGGCKTCKDFDFYKENGTLVDGFANVISVIQVKSSGYVFVSWSAEKNEKQKKYVGIYHRMCEILWIGKNLYKRTKELLNFNVEHLI